MNQPIGQKRPTGIYLALVWMVLNLVLFILMIPGDSTDINNYIEIILWITSIGWLATMKKAGAAFATTVLGITLGTSIGNVLLSYYYNVMNEPVAYINALRIVINAIIIVYMYRRIFSGNFK